MVNPFDLTGFEVLALTIIGEGRGEPIQGQVGIGNVIRNRLLHYKVGDYKDVCLKKAQFSCWNESDTNRALLIDLAEQLINGQMVTDIYLKQCFFVARGIISGTLIDNTKGSLYYLENKKFIAGRPDWALNAKNEIFLGNQTFFNV